MDFQNYGVHPDGYWAERDPALIERLTERAVVETARRALETARGAGMHVLRTVVLAGVATNFVVEGTAREAADLGYDVVVLADACETLNDEWQRFSLEIMATLGTVITVDEFAERVRR